jgi:hypothetical protein
MAKVDYNKCNETLINRLVRFVKSAKCPKGEYRTYQNDNEFTFEVENDGLLANDLSYIIHKDERAILISHIEHKGIYDWASDTYIKPVSSVTYRFT